MPIPVIALTAWGTAGSAALSVGSAMGLLSGISGVSSLSNWLKEKRRSSPAYKTPEAGEGLIQDIPLPIVYGKNKVTGHVIYREETYDKDYDFAAALCEGEVSAIDNVRLEGRAIDDIGDSSYTAYTGTSSQAGDDIFKKGFVVMPCAADAFISELNKDTNYNTNYLMVKSDPYERRIYLKFSLTAIPPDLTITAAEIRLRKSFVTDTNSIKGHKLSMQGCCYMPPCPRSYRRKRLFSIPRPLR